MSIDKEKQIYGTWLNVDVGLHCYCGLEIGIYDPPEELIVCPDCGQPWRVRLSAEEAEEVLPTALHDTGG